MQIRRTWLSVVAALVAVPALAAAAPSMDSSYHVVARWQLGGDGGWDYMSVDPATSQLYITRGAHVMVVNTANGKLIDDMTGFQGTHGVVFDADGKYGYISDGRANQIVVFDRHTHAVVAHVAAGTNPDGILFEPFTKTVWAFNGRSKNATVMDTRTNKVLATVPLAGKPEFPTSDGKGSVFVNIEDKSLLEKVDARTMKPVAQWPLAPCESPSGQAADTEHEILFSVCDGKVMTATDGNSGKVVATVPIGDGPDAAGFDAQRKLVYSSNGDGTLTVVRQEAANRYTVVANVPTQRSARTMALDEKTGKVYVVAAKFGPRPAPTAANPHPWPTIVPGSFVVLVVAR